MPKLPRFKENVRVSPSSPVRAFSGRGASLAGKDQQAFAQGVQKLGIAALKIDKIKAMQDRKIFALDQEMELEQRMLESFRNATNRETGADESGNNYLDRFNIETEKIRGELDTISDAEIKASLLSKSTRLEARYGGKLRTGSLAKNNVFNANRFEKDISYLSGSVAIDPSMDNIFRSLTIAETAATTRLNLLDQRGRQTIVDKAFKRIVQAGINTNMFEGTQSGFREARKLLASPLVNKLLSSDSINKLRKDIDAGDLARVSKNNLMARENERILKKNILDTRTRLIRETNAMYSLAKTQQEKDQVRLSVLGNSAISGDDKKAITDRLNFTDSSVSLVESVSMEKKILSGKMTPDAADLAAQSPHSDMTPTGVTSVMNTASRVRKANGSPSKTKIVQQGRDWLSSKFAKKSGFNIFDEGGGVVSLTSLSSGSQKELLQEAHNLYNEFVVAGDSPNLAKAKALVEVTNDLDFSVIGVPDIAHPKFKDKTQVHTDSETQAGVEAQLESIRLQYYAELKAINKGNPTAQDLKVFNIRKARFSRQRKMLKIKQLIILSRVQVDAANKKLPKDKVNRTGNGAE